MAAGDGLGPSAPACSFRQQTPNCHEVVGRNGLPGSTGETLPVAVGEKVLRGLRCLRAVLSLSVLWKIPAITGEIVRSGAQQAAEKKCDESQVCFHKTDAGEPLNSIDILMLFNLVWSWN